MKPDSLTTGFGLSGSGEVVLHNLKNWGLELESRCGDLQVAGWGEVSKFGDAVSRFIMATREIASRLIEDDPKWSDQLIAFNKVVKQAEADAISVRDGNKSSSLHSLAEFLKVQYNQRGVWNDIIKGEPISLFSAPPLSPVECALKKVVKALAPPELLRVGRLMWADDGDGKTLCIRLADSERPHHLGIVVTPADLAPKDLRRILAENGATS